MLKFQSESFYADHHNTGITDQIFSDPKMLTCVKRRFLFVESGAVSVLQLFQFCSPDLGQLYCFQTSLRKDMTPCELCSGVYIILICRKLKVKIIQIHTCCTTLAL